MMTRNLDLLKYLIEKTSNNIIKWEEIKYYTLTGKREIYKGFVTSNIDYNIIQEEVYERISSMYQTELPVNNVDVRVYHTNVKGMDVYLLEQINFYTSYPSRKYNLEIIRIDEENRRNSFHQIIKGEEIKNKILLEKLAAIVSNIPFNEENNADEFIAYLVDDD